MPIVINGTTGISGVDGSAGTPAVQGTDTNTGVFYPAADTIAFSKGGVEAGRFNSSGNLQIYNLGLGATTPSTSGTGITFPATQSASSDVNTLDDYEEGTWTVSDQSGAGLTLTNTTGRYVKVGRVVYITCFPTYPSTASGSAARLSLPFAVSGEYSSLIKSYIGGAIAQTNWLPLAENGQSYFTFRDPAGGDTQASNANLTSKSLIVSGCYLTST